MKHPAIRAAHADRKSTPRRLERLRSSVRAHQDRHRIRRQLAAVALQYSHERSTRP